MEMKNHKGLVVIIVLLVMNLCVSGVLALNVFSPAKTGGQIDFTAAENSKYTLYIGTNDKDTYEQMIDTPTAIDIVNNICAENMCGYTMAEAKGGWAEDGKLYHENTLVYTLVGVSEKQVVAVMREAREQLNQNTILVELADSTSAYYDGTEK